MMRMYISTSLSLLDIAAAERHALKLSARLGCLVKLPPTHEALRNIGGLERGALGW